jgi:hypothetical protein
VLARRLQLIVAVVLLLTGLVACGEAGLPTPTVAPAPPTSAPATPQSTPAANAATTPAAGSASDEDLVRSISVLEQMRGHLLAAQELSATGANTQAAEQAGYPARELLDTVASSLGATGMDTSLRAALDSYTAAATQGGPAAATAQTVALQQIDAVEQAIAGQNRLADPIFRATVLRELLEKVEEEYRESLKDGKVAQLEPYQSAYGILQAVRLVLPQMSAGLAADKQADFSAATAAVDQLRAALPGPQAPAAPVSAETVEHAVDAAIDALNRVGGLNATQPAAGTLIENARTGVKDAIALYKAGQADAAYEKAASAYLDNVEKLEPDLLKADKDIVPSLEGDFKALRDGIKAGSPAADLDAIAARIDAGLTRAAGMLGQ